MALGPGPVQRLEVPGGAQLLAADVKDGRAWVWFSCTPGERRITRTFLLIPTGGPYGEGEGEDEGWSRLLDRQYHVETFLSEDRELVGHLFETGPINPEIEAQIVKDLRAAGKTENGGGWA